jgi:hypothetical protein
MTASAKELHNPEFERAVVAGVLLLGVEGLEAALSEKVDYRDFYDERLRLIFRASVDLARSKREIDLLTVKNKLSESGDLEKVGVPFLSGLIEGVPRAINIKNYAMHVVQDSAYRRKLKSLDTALQAAMSGNGNFDEACSDVLRALSDDRQHKTEHNFQQIAEDRYRLEISEIAATLEIDRLRREHNEAIGELTVKCTLPGIRAFDGNISTADFNLSSARARSDRAKLIESLAKTKNIDWPNHLEELCQRVLLAERTGQPAIDLRRLNKPAADDFYRAGGLWLPRRHPTIIFGDGSSAKSYLGEYILGLLSKQGIRVGFFDWELAGEDHRDRLERLFGLDMPEIFYAKCERALVHEVDRLRRIKGDHKLDYALFDSIAFACDGPPESAEVAGRYFRAVRQIGVGSLHIAHITKSEGGDQKPFGSVFWHNGARATYYVQLSDASADGKTISIGLFNRKSNLSGLQQPTGYLIRFTDDQTYIQNANPADIPDLAEKMSVRQRLAHILKHGAMPLEQAATSLNAKPDTLRRTVQRYKQQFIIIDGGKVALSQ